MRHLLFLALLAGPAAVWACNDKCSEDSECDDGLFCNGPEQCSRGRCSSTLRFPCSDGDPCTVDMCDEELDQCRYEAGDRDGDGYPMAGCLDGTDCNDFDPEVHPGAEERCNSRDDDCSGVAEEDRDNDFHFDPAYCADGDDCDDDDRNVYPGAPEICDGIDNNCVLGTDDEEDTDGDGSLDETCGGDDCDDEDGSRSPDADEICNGEDDDCDGLCDDAFECCMDEDYECLTSCGTLGTASCGGDCALGACEPPPEACNGIDDDCDGAIDEDLPCAPAELVECETECGSLGLGNCTDLCEIPPPGDCFPPDEECDGLDNDCDGEVDETFVCRPGETTLCVTECDSQGLGPCTEACGVPPPGECTPPEDEICWNYKDDNCDGFVDEFCY